MLRAELFMVYTVLLLLSLMVKSSPEKDIIFSDRKYTCTAMLPLRILQSEHKYRSAYVRYISRRTIRMTKQYGLEKEVYVHADSAVRFA